MRCKKINENKLFPSFSRRCRVFLWKCISTNDGEETFEEIFSLSSFLKSKFNKVFPFLDPTVDDLAREIHFSFWLKMRGAHLLLFLTLSPHFGTIWKIVYLDNCLSNPWLSFCIWPRFWGYRGQRLSPSILFAHCKVVSWLSATFKG